MKSSVCFEPEGSSSRRHSSTNKTAYIALVCKQIIPHVTYNLLPEDEPWGSKHVENIVKIKILLTKMSFSQKHKNYIQ